MSEWGSWSDCSCTRDGEKQRSRVISRFGRADGDFCNGDLKQVMSCNVAETPTPAPKKPCDESHWQKSPCKSLNGKGCGAGTSTWTRHRENGGCDDDVISKIVSCKLK